MTISILWLGRILPILLNAGDRVYSAQLATHVVFVGLENIDKQGGDLAQVDAQRSRLNHALICTMNMHNEHE